MSGRGPATDWSRLVQDVPDFPEPGILFKDLAPVFGDPAGLAALVAELAAAAGPVAPDAVVAVEARGFIIGAPLALALGVGFVPVRKPGKLPRATRSVAYALEYGAAVLHMQTDALAPGARVLLVDDVLATGGTLAAAAELVAGAGARVLAALVVLEIAALGGRARLPGAPVTALRAV